MEQIIKKIYERVAVVNKAIVIKESNDSPMPWDSKVGGKPYLLEDDDYPVSFDTLEPFEFLIQINCHDLPKNDYFPGKGLLQFFINNDYTYEKEDKPFLVKYIEDIVIDENKIDYDFDDDYECEDEEVDEEDDEIVETMIKEEVKITFSLKDDHVNSTTLEWDNFKSNLAMQLYQYKDDLEDYDSFIEESNYLEDLDFILGDEEVVEVMQSSKLLGYPDNYEEDVRLDSERYQDYILLLQLHPNSDFFENEEEISICWFIDPKDLKELKFDNVICSYFPK